MENQTPIMEIVQVRLYDPGEAGKVLIAFLRIREAFGTRCSLYRDNRLDSDWTIRIDRPEHAIQPGKSQAVRCAAELLRAIGLVHHAVLKRVPSESVHAVSGFADRSATP